MSKEEFKLEATFPDFLKNELDSEQQNAVIKSKGHSIIIAGPGSGKTRVITYKIAYLIYQGLEPKDILLVTFTRAAAKQMIERAKNVVNNDLKGLIAGTFHHVCNLILRKFCKKLGYENNYTILDSEDSKDLMKIIRKEYLDEINLETKNFPKETIIMKIISYSMNTLKSIRETIGEIAPYLMSYEKDIESIFTKYSEAKRDINAMDYDDLLINTAMLLKTNKEILNSISNKFKYVLVDEFQDTNKIQLEIVEALSSIHGNLIVVGDDAQSIYSFRGARYENIEEFIKKDKTNLFKIQTNYRSTPDIVNLINNMIPENSVKKDLKSVRKEYLLPNIIETHDDLEQMDAVRKIINDKLDEGISLNDIAILYRSHALSMSLQQTLDRAQIPYNLLSGRRFIETAHIKDTLAFLKLLQNPYDRISWIRVLKLFPGVGVKTALRSYYIIIETLRSNKDIFEALNKANIKNKDAYTLLKKLYEKSEEKPETLIYDILEEYYREYSNMTFRNAPSRNADIERFAEISSRYENLSEFLEDMVLSETIEVKGAEKDYNKEELTMTTVHGAKGLEWKIVIIISVNPGDFPNGMAIKEKKLNEEERLFYVAITRAKDELYMLKQLTGTTNPYMRNSFVFIKKENDFISKIPKEIIKTLKTTYN